MVFPINLNDFLVYFNYKFKFEGFFIILNANNIPIAAKSKVESCKHLY